jgi:hypothetical protein
MGKKIELEDCYEHHVRAWRVKRILWALLLLVILAAAVGLLGPGALSKGEAQSGGLVLNYDCIGRRHAPAQFRLSVPSASNSLELTINSEFLRKIELEHIDPEPTEMSLAGENQRWIFARRTDEPTEIRIHFRAEEIGGTRARLEIAGVGIINIKPFFLP